MLEIIRRVLRLSGDLAGRLRLSFVFSFIDALFEMVPFGCLFYLLVCVRDGALDGGAVLLAAVVLAVALAGRFLF